MDRIIVYPGAIPLDTDLLSTNRNTMTALGALISATLGTSSAIDGLTVSATTPPSMSVVVGPGSITQYGPLDALPYGSLPADTADSVVKMGVLLAPVTLTLTAPTIPGTQIVYLIEASFVESDADQVVLPYYNAANPAQPYLGPGNTGSAQATLRQQLIQVQLKSGAATPTGGAQSIPPVDPGWFGLAEIAVTAGTTAIPGSAIFAGPTLRTTAWKLPDLTPGYAFAQTFSSSGSFVIPNGITRLRVTALGAGGAGASNAGSGSGGGGGGAGGLGTVWLNAGEITAGQVVPITIGASGVPAAGAAGGPGGTTSFGTYLSVTGGAGGNGLTGGTGGAPVGTLVGTIFVGAYGGDGVPGVARGGDGGGPGNGKGGSVGNNGTNAAAFGGGGGGAGGGGSAGGAGGGGLVTVEW